MNYDGTIRIDSRINAQPFNNGVKAMTAALKPLALAIAATFSVAAIVAFGQTAVREAAKLSSELVGLQSVVEGTGNSFNAAQEFINQYVSDGLVPAGDAITAYKTLLLRGYDTSQVEQVLNILKDSAAFGRQGSLSMGQAIRSAAEGIKNGNSILVDNAGITRNLSLLHKDFAASIGTTVGMLTEEQKILAEVNGFMHESRFQTGDAAKLAGTYAGQIGALSTSFLNLRVAIGSAIIPIVQTLLPYIRAAVNALTIFFNKLASVMSILFGVNIAAARQSMADMAAATEEAAAAQDNLASSTEKAGKAAKGALAPFDELNVLAQPDSGASGGVVAPEVGGIGGGALDPATVDDQLDELRAKVEAWKESFLSFIQPVSEAWDRLWTAAQPLIERVGNILLWLWNNVLQPVGAWIVQVLVPAVMGLVGSFLTLIDSVLNALAPSFLWLWDTVLRPLGEWIGTVLIGAIEWLGRVLLHLSGWIDDNATAFNLIVLAVLSLVAAVWLVYFAFQAYVFIAGLASTATATFGAIMAILTSPIFAIILAVAALIAIIVLLVKNWDVVKQKTQEALAFLLQKQIENIALIQEKVIKPLGAAWQWFLDSLRVGWQRTFDGIVGIARGAANFVIDIVNSMIRAVVSGINSVIGAMNSIKVDIPSWVPVLGGQSFGVNIPTVSAPQIPRLAKGAVIPPNAEFLAVMGDQRNGRNLEAPEGLIRQIIQEEIGNINVDVNLNADPNFAAFWRMLKPYADRAQVRIGDSLIAGGAA